jgi:hypothetical protein
MPKYVLADNDPAATFLAGFNNNSDQAYALVTGVTGGQTVIGSDTTNEDLSLRSNSADLGTGSVNVLDTLDASSKTVGALTVAGGLAVAKKLYAGASTVDSLTVGTLAGVLKGTAGAVGAATAGSDFAVGSTGLAGGQTIAGSTLTEENLTLRGNAADTTTGQVNVSSSLEAASTSVAAFTVAGGVGIAKKLKVAGETTLATSLSGILKATSGVVAAATAGTDFAVGSTGLAGGQTIAGSTLTEENLTLRGNAADTTTGQVNVSSSLEASSTSVASLTTAGGLGVAKKLFAGGTIVPRTGSATAGTAPIKMTSGALLGTPEAGALEFNSDNFYGTISTGAARKAFTMSDKLFLPGYAHAAFKSPTGSTGIFHAFGYYKAPAGAKAFSQAATTQVYGTANGAYGAKAFVVTAAAGTASGGTTGTAKITVTGTSVSDEGVRTASDSEILLADVTAATANGYYETAKYWIGQVTFTIAATDDRDTFALDANYGFAKYYEFGESKVIINKFEMTGRAGGNDTGFDVQLLKHDGTGWTYSAAAFVPGGTVICSMATDYNTEKNLVSGDRFGYERYHLNTEIDGTVTMRGAVCRITTGANNAVESSDLRMEFKYV